jgi:hypothetical protein
LIDMKLKTNARKNRQTDKNIQHYFPVECHSPEQFFGNDWIAESTLSLLNRVIILQV